MDELEELLWLCKSAKRLAGVKRAEDGWKEPWRGRKVGEDPRGQKELWQSEGTRFLTMSV